MAIKTEKILKTGKIPMKFTIQENLHAVLST